MTNLILFGPPGSGKGTQAAYIKEKYDIHHISTGDLVRREIKGETALGNEVKKYSQKGQLVPDSVIIDILRKEVESHPNAKGFIFDGFPRTVPQAAALDEFLAEKDTEISCLIELRVDDEELIKRILDRGKDSGRVDDQNTEIITSRLKVYKDETVPVALYYAQKDKAFTVDGIGSIEEVFDRICYRIDEQTKP